MWTYYYIFANKNGLRMCCCACYGCKLLHEILYPHGL